MSPKHPQGLFNKIKSLLAYKPPQHNTFVLPELQEEDRDRVSPEERKELDYGDSGSQDAGNEKKKPKRKPVRAGEWNRIKGENHEPGDERTKGDRISPDLQVSMEIIKREFNIPANIDMVVREFKLAHKVEAFVVFVDGMSDRGIINDFVLRELMQPGPFENFGGGCLLQYITDNVLSVNQTKRLERYQAAVKQVLMGVTGLFVEGCDACLLIETRGYEKRGIEKPSTESVVRGSQEAFTENLKTSITQIRRIIRNQDLIHEMVPVGKTDNSLASVLYLKGIANPALVKEVKRRLKSIKIDAILGAGMLEEFIEDNPWLVIPQVLTTERPDRTASQILEGKVAILCEGAPFASIVPVSFHALMQSPEDYLLRWQFGTVMRLIRTFAFFLALFLPGAYIAITNYHQEMLPTDLLVSIARAREAVPFPTIVEVILMEISFELIREAGVRVPGIIGTTLGIIGALILGQAAVAANIVSPILIIIVAVTGLGNFAIPNYALAFGVRILRFFFILMGGILGFFGLAAGMVIVTATALSMKSFGVPFLAPSWPKATGPDQIIRLPNWLDEERPDAIQPLNRKKQPETARGWTEEDPPEGNRE